MKPESRHLISLIVFLPLVATLSGCAPSVVTPGSMPLDQPEKISKGSLHPQIENPIQVFRSKDAPAIYRWRAGESGAISIAKIYVWENGKWVPAQRLRVVEDLIEIQPSRVGWIDGKTRLDFLIEDAEGAVFTNRFEFWSGNRSLTLFPAGKKARIVEVSLAEDQGAMISVNLGSKPIRIKNLPRRVLYVETRGNQSGVFIGPNELEHHLSPQTKNFLTAGPTPELPFVLKSRGIGNVTARFSVSPPSGARVLTLRYRLLTSEIHSPELAPLYDDGFELSAQLPGSDTIQKKIYSVVGSGAGHFFSPQGESPVLDWALPVGTGSGPVVIELNVGNFGDSAFDSAIVIDEIRWTSLNIGVASLHDIDDRNDPLSAVSFSQSPFFSEQTPFFTKLSLVGEPGDFVDDAQLQFLFQGRVTGAAYPTREFWDQASLPFDSEGRWGRGDRALDLFELDSRALPEKVGIELPRLLPRLWIRTRSGAFLFRDLGGPIPTLTRYLAANRYPVCNDISCRDPQEGGDDWVLPKWMKFLDSFFESFIVGDISNLHGGFFVGHASHREGRDIDAYFDGYELRDQRAAEKLIGYLNDETWGPSIEAIFVTFTPEFRRAIRDVVLSDGSFAATRIVDISGHKGHFHLRMTQNEL